MVDVQSLREWLDSWGSGPNWSDCSGATVPISKVTLSALLDELDHLRLLQLPASDFSSHAARLRAKVREQAIEIARYRRAAGG